MQTEVISAPSISYDLESNAAVYTHTEWLLFSSHCVFLEDPTAVQPLKASTSAKPAVSNGTFNSGLPA